MYKYAASHSSAESVPDIEICTSATLLEFRLTRTRKKDWETHC